MLWEHHTKPSRLWLTVGHSEGHALAPRVNGGTCGSDCFLFVQEAFMYRSVLEMSVRVHEATLRKGDFGGDSDVQFIGFHIRGLRLRINTEASCQGAHTQIATSPNNSSHRHPVDPWARPQELRMLKSTWQALRPNTAAEGET